MTPARPGFDRFLCPVDNCHWTHDQEPMQIPDGATEQDLTDLSKLHNAQVSDTLQAHYETHGLEDWLRTISRLKQLVDARPPVLVCLYCHVDRHNAQKAGLELPALRPAQLIVDGAGACIGHFKIVDGPVMPDRTESGFILPSQQLPPINGQGLIGPNGGN
jgi:hypothetical protein